jgi:acylphosphatase
MKKCVRIVFTQENGFALLDATIKDVARKLDLEGTAAQVHDNEYEIIVHGEKEKVDQFIDKAIEQFIQEDVDDYHVEPFLKEEDYRGVFRVVR